MNRIGRAYDGFGAWIAGAEHATRSLSLLRIVYALAMLAFLLPSFADRSMLWGRASTWIDPEMKRNRWIFFDTLFQKGSPVLFDLAYLALILLVLLFLAGVRTRIVTPVLLLFWVSLQSNNTYVNNGGDTLMRITLVFLVFANLGEHYSFDAWWRRRRARDGAARLPRSAPRFPLARTALHNTALLLCMAQIVFVYTVSGFYKLMGETWLDGTALYYALTLADFRVYPLVNELVWQSSPAIIAATWVSTVAQLGFLPLVLWRRTRHLVVLVLLGMHAGIALLLGLVPFSLAMIALDLLFVSDAAWSRLARCCADVWDRVLAPWRRASPTATEQQHPGRSRYSSGSAR